MDERSAVDSYVVRIYRRSDGGRDQLDGVVEVVGDGQHAFHTMSELWRLISVQPPRRKPRTKR